MYATGLLQQPPPNEREESLKWGRAEQSCSSVCAKLNGDAPWEYHHLRDDTIPCNSSPDGCTPEQVQAMQCHKCFTTALNPPPPPPPPRAAGGMPCSDAEAPIARLALEKALAGDTAGGLAEVGKLDGGQAGKCGGCLLGNLATPDNAIPECIGTIAELCSPLAST